MPARKSDARRSDVSVARFVLADDDDGQVTQPASAESPAPAAATSVPPQAPPTQTSSSPHEKKDKESAKDKDKDRDAITIEDLTLPKSIITRLAKGVLPPNTQIQANAILALSKSATVFVNHLAASANELTTSANKKTIMPQDVFKALEETEFGFMRERVEAEFAKFNEIQTSKRSTYRKKVAAAKKAVVSGDGTSVAGDMSMMSTTSHDPNETMRSDVGGEQSRAAKKARIDPSGGDDSRMEPDDHDPSDAETVPDENEDDEDEEEDDDVEEEEDDEEEENGADPDRDGDDDRAAPPDEDEALDDEDSE